MSLFITEFTQEGIDALGRIMPCAKQLPVAQQKINITSSSVQSAGLNANTTLVRLHPTLDCCVLFGGNPTATANTMRIAANQTEYFCVQANSGFRIAVIEV
jgi:hypothetical protein